MQVWQIANQQKRVAVNILPENQLNTLDRDISQDKVTDEDTLLCTETNTRVHDTHGHGSVHLTQQLHPISPMTRISILQMLQGYM